MNLDDSMNPRLLIADPDICHFPRNLVTLNFPWLSTKFNTLKIQGFSDFPDL